MDSGLLADTLYCYAVSANNAAGVESSKSAQVCATTQLTAPPTPTGLTAAGSAGPPPTVRLTWSASAGAAKYNIYRDGGVTPSLSVNAPAVTALDIGLDITALNPQTNYCYTISAEDVSGNESEQSTQVCTSTGGAAPPPKPTGLTATLLAGPQVRLNWSASSGAVVYRIYRDGTLKLSATGVTATDTGVGVGTVYCYTVAAEDGAGNVSAKSAAVCIATGAMAPPPTPTNLAVAGGAGPKITLTWTTSAGADHYLIYRNGETIPLVSVVGAQVVDLNVEAATRYCYTISSVDALGNESAQSAPACGTAGAAPPTALPPTGVTATAMSSLRIDVSWSASVGAVSYIIYRNGTSLQTVTGTTFSDATVLAENSYCYTIAAVDSSGNPSAQSAQGCAITPP